MITKETSMIKLAWEVMNKPKPEPADLSMATLLVELEVLKIFSNSLEWVVSKEEASLLARTFSKNSRNSSLEADNKRKEAPQGLVPKETISCSPWR